MLCGKNIVSVHSLDKPYPVYCSPCWWGDNWDPFSAGRSYDSSRRFFEQYRAVFNAVPQLAMENDNGVGSENSEYCQDISRCKDCYLLTGSWHCRNVYYSTNCNHSRDLVDCDSTNLECELAYECSDSQHLYNSVFLRYSANCSGCSFGIDLKSCADCFCCVGLRQKQYCVFNEQYSASEYKEKIKAFDLRSYKTLKETQFSFEQFALKYPRRAVQQVNCEDCFGDNLFNCRDVFGFDTFNAEHCRYFYKGDSPVHCYDVHQSGNPQWCYDSVTPDDSYMACFTTWCWKGNRSIYYCDNCHSSKHLFGCVGLKRHEYCILNRQYSKDDYEALVPKIIEDMKQTGDWGEFFPEALSPFGYNETVAHEWFPLAKEQAAAKGLPWREIDPKEYMPATAVLSDLLQETPESIVKEILSCAECRRNYKIIRKELEFYQRMELALPRLCPSCRRQKRWALRNPYMLWRRTCAKCGTAVHTVYSEKRPERVYCEKCYLGEVYL